ncbi:OmpA family protein [Henriciella sp.]|uniref:OmpA/MotB family protein n=1 Tax=Henriciella sp. TaxID=1968823 RepID=UPI002624AE86|nr:OmpA family protein [Henriciella sp.]
MASEYASMRIEGRTPRAPVRRIGAWKLAYADFLTALCALFIVLWLASGATSEERSNLAEQFGAKPVSDVVASQLSALDQAEATLRQSELLSAKTGNVSLTREVDGFRIELIDLDHTPLFETGEESLNERGLWLIDLASQAIIRLAQPIWIEGHTDSQPVMRSDYSNWELSAGRANAARRALIATGVPAELIAGVTGLADTRPLRPGTGDLPQNRRLSIVVHIDERP